MSKLNDLIKELCPNGVEYVKLEELVDYIQPAKYIVKNTNYDIKYDVPVLTAGQTFILGYTYEKDGIYYASADNPVIIFDDFTTSNHWVDFNFKVKSSAMKILISKTDNLFKYIYYCISNIDYVPKEHSRQWIQVYSQFQIPLPPLKVQKEIARILDKFGELEAELEARKSQYEFWREKLLNNKKYSVVSLGNYATFSQGIQVDPKNQKAYCADGMVPFLRIVDFVKDDESPRYIIKPDNKYIKRENEEMVMIRYGASAAGKVFINKYGAIANNMFKINLTTNEIDIKYLWHYLSQDKIYKSLNNTGGGSTMPAINFKMASSIQVVLPPKEEQNRIVKILDKFEELANDINVGLPAEIELRRKQYEYYRNKLLSFEELSVDD